MKLNLKNEKGITMIAIVITVIILLIIVSTVSFSSKNGIEMKNINNMHADILVLEDKIAMYYLKNKTLPVKGVPIIETEIPEDIKNFNPNDSYIEPVSNAKVWYPYYTIDLTLLDNIDLNNAQDIANVKDIYIINEKSHTIYYLKGVKVNEYNNAAVDRKAEKTYYTIPREYAAVDLDTIEAELSGADRTYTNPEYFTYSSAEPSIITGFNTSKIPVDHNEYREYDDTGALLDFVIPYERVVVESNGIVKKIKITKIEDGAFSSDNTSIRIVGNVEVPNRIVIGKEAFKGQNKITKVDLNLNGIEEDAFTNCTNLKNVKIRGLRVISEKAFRSLNSLEKLEIGAPVEEIEAEAFSGMKENVVITFPTTLKRIKAKAFADPEGYNGVTKIDLTNCPNLLEIGEYAFYNHKNINTILFSPVARIEIDHYAFNNWNRVGDYTVVLNDYTSYYVNSFPGGVHVEEGTLLDPTDTE